MEKNWKERAKPLIDNDFFVDFDKPTKETFTPAKTSESLNEDAVVLGTLAGTLAVGLALGLANAAVGGFFWDSLKSLAHTIFKRKPKTTRWLAYKNYIIEDSESGQINIWDLNGTQIGTDVKTLKVAKKLIKERSKEENTAIDTAIDAAVATELEAVAGDAEIEDLDPLVEIDPVSLETTEVSAEEEIEYVAPQDESEENPIDSIDANPLNKTSEDSDNNIETKTISTEESENSSTTSDVVTSDNSENQYMDWLRSF